MEPNPVSPSQHQSSNDTNGHLGWAGAGGKSGGGAGGGEGVGSGAGRRWVIRGVKAAAGLAAAAGVMAAIGFAPRSELATGFIEGLSERIPAELPLAAIAQAENGEIPGWFARYAGSGGGSNEIKTHAPYAAFALEAGQSVHPGVPAAGLTATFDAEVTTDAAGKYRFGAEVEGGTVQIKILGERMTAPITVRSGPTQAAAGPKFSEWIDLPVGKVTLQFQFKRAGNQKARLRSMWERQGFGRAGFRSEPIPPTSATVPSGVRSEVESAMSSDRGRVLLGELGCVHCHNTSDADMHPGHMAELASSFATIPHWAAPNLQEVGKRASPYWITKWMADPQGEKPGCGMPAVLRGKDMGTDAENITHFLVSLSPGGFETESVANEPAGLDLAKHTYQSVGCVACHGATPGQKDAPIPLTGLSGKWNPSELAEFLLDPRKDRPSGRMPSLVLNRQEADLIATHLISTFGESSAPKNPFKVDQAKADAGRTAFAARGCASCHSVKDSKGVVVEPLVKANPLASLGTGGCLDPKGTPKAPKYQLTEADRKALTAAIGDLKSWMGGKGAAGLAASNFADAQLAVSALSCRNCHVAYGTGGLSADADKLFRTIGEADLGEEGRVPPRLTSPGMKLTTQWLHEVLENAGRARPYMAARMPQFGARNVSHIAEGFGLIEGVWPNSAVGEPPSDDDTVQAGRKLAGITGLNCISCHVVGDNAPAGTPGPDMTMFASRLRYEWWMDYVHAPGRFKPGTRMPAFYENGTGTVTAVYGGDSIKQTNALWSYFNLGQFMPVPEGIAKPEGFVIKVGSRPMVMRSFMRDAGSRGIAVGFPDALGGIHFSFDAAKVRLVEAWQGTFLNASGAWAGRGGNVTGGQGSEVWEAPAGPAVVIAPTEPKEWPRTVGKDAGYSFKGYRLDERGFPTFEYEVTASDDSKVQVAERFESTPEKKIKRTFEFTGLKDGAKAFVHAGKGFEEAAAGSSGSTVTTSKTGDDTVVSVVGAAGKPVSVSMTIKP